jgi:hypothetical protein
MVVPHIAQAFQMVCGWGLLGIGERKQGTLELDR